MANLALVGPGKTVLEDDAINKQTASVSIQCKSIKGEVYKIKIKTFLNLIKTDKDSFQAFLEHCTLKK